MDRPVGSTAGKKAILALLLLVATGIAYLPTYTAEFGWDDETHIVENEALRDRDGLRRIWLDRASNWQYYPVVFSTFWLEYQLWGLQPGPYHAANVLLHAISALLVWRLLSALSLPGAWLAGLLFALHPVHVESVAWVMERKNVLSGVFYLTSGLSYLRFRKLDVEEHGPLGFYWLALLLFALALLSKSVTASLPAAILLLVYWKTGRVTRRDVAWLLPFFALGVAAGLNTIALEQEVVGAAGDEWSLSPLERLLIASRAICFYASKLLWPHPLIFSYPRWDVDPAVWWQYLYGFIVFACFLVLFSARLRIGRGPLVAALFFAGSLLPALGFFDVYPMRFSFVADHFVYLASLGIIVPLAYGVVRAGSAIGKSPRTSPRVLFAATVGLGCLALAAATFLQSRVYHDEESLWRDTLRKNPSSWLAHNNLGRIHGLRQEHDRAARHFRSAIELKADYYVAETNLAEALIRLGRFRDAVPHLEHALEIEPGQADAHYFLGVAFANLGQWDDAVRHLRKQTALQPSFETHLEAARILARGVRRREALTELDRAEAYRPKDASLAFQRGNLYMALNEPEQAVVAYREALARRADWAVAHNRLGLAFERLGDFARAEQQYAHAVRIDPTLAPALRNLARSRAQRDRGQPDAKEPGESQ